MRRYIQRALLVSATALLAACSVRDVDEKKGDSAAPSSGATTVAPSPAASGPTAGATAAAAGTSAAAAGMDSIGALRVEVDLKARELRLLQGGTTVETHRVAVGSAKWPTQTGQWTIKQVVWNPEWIPPDETWADEREPKKPGDPENPLGRVQLVYDPPRTIHGTNKPSSIGQAVSHGSIRMRNDELEQVARTVMTAGGAPKDEAWIRQALANRTQKQIVELPRPVPVRVF